MDWWLTLGFSGHRSLPDAQLKAIAASGERALALVRDAFDLVVAKGDPSDTRSSKVRILTGMAKGADQMMASAARNRDDTRLHALYPYCDPAQPDGGWTDRDESDPMPWGADDTPWFDHVTVLDGAAAEAEAPGLNGHLQLLRFMVRHANLLLVIWDPSRAAGPGGTADAAHMALMHGHPVLWIDPRDPERLRLIDPGSVWPEISASELATALQNQSATTVAPSARAENLSALLGAALLPPWLQDDRDQAARDRQRLSYDTFQTESARTGLNPIRRFHDSGYDRYVRRVAKVRQQPRTSETGTTQSQSSTTALSGAFDNADEAANRLSARHRSNQFYQLRLATAAVFFGVLPALKGVPGVDLIPHLKLFCVAVELVLLILMMLSWRAARKARLHLAWSDTRHFSERLRGMMATWPLGVDAADDRPPASGAWGEWRAQMTRAELGPRTGRMTAETLLSEAGRATALLIAGQAGYHQSTAHKMNRIHHRIEKLESRLFWFLALALGGFILLQVVGPSTILADWSLFGTIMKAYAAVLLFLSALIPALGAAWIGQEAQLDFAGTGRRSDSIAPRFTQLEQAMTRARDKGAALQAVHIVRAAALLALNDVAGWRSDPERRQILRGP